jgi:hypothetical protein
MSDLPVVADERFARAPETLRPTLLLLLHAIEQAPNERAAWSALADALRYVLECLSAGELNNSEAQHLDELYIFAKEKRGGSLKDTVQCRR